ncbi:MAG: endonuclease [Verrucomicrobia bacterium]|jgi:hypothetical protein|nr:MAG: endonuclease [Verrucomicrobiota bacterium]
MARNRYEQLIERIFLAHYKRGNTEVTFEREEIAAMAKRIGIEIPKNLGDLIYSFRYRVALPSSITDKAPKGKEWIIRPVGRSKYQFVLVTKWAITPNPSLSRIKVPDATPGMITKYALSDEQALLAKLRYNRLIDIFTGVTCYSLQSHLRTTVPNIGQVETDEVYVGVDRQGAHYVVPVQAKGGKDRLSIVQIEQDIAVCATKFKDAICRPLGAQFIQSDLIALFEFETTSEGVRVRAERHYHLVLPEELTEEDLRLYRLPPPL